MISNLTAALHLKDARRLQRISPHHQHTWHAAATLQLETCALVAMCSRDKLSGITVTRTCPPCRSALAAQNKRHVGSYYLKRRAVCLDGIFSECISDLS